MPRTLLLESLISILAVAMTVASAHAQPKEAVEMDLSLCWTFPVETSVRRVAADRTRLYAALVEAKLAAHSFDGKRAWSSDLGGEVVSNILTTDSDLFVVTASMGESPTSVLRTISLDTGIVAATQPLPVADRHFLFWVNRGLLVVSASGVVQMIDDKGTVKWRREIASAFAGTPSIGADKLLVASTASQMFTINLAAGEIESVKKLPHDVTALGVTQTGLVVVGDERGNLTSFDQTGARNWRFRTGGRISGIFAANGHIFAMSHDNFIYCIDASNGSVTWKRRLAGRASHAAAINGAYLLTTSLDEHGATVTSSAGGKPAGQIVLDEDEFITADPVSAGGLLVIGTNDAIYGYSITGAAGCPNSKNAAIGPLGSVAAIQN